MIPSYASPSKTTYILAGLDLVITAENDCWDGHPQVLMRRWLPSFLFTTRNAAVLVFLVASFCNAL